MAGVFNNIWQWMGGRTARNVYFWLVVSLILAGLNLDADAYPRVVYNDGKIITTLLLLLITLVNNWWVVPRLLAKRKYILYIFVAVLLLIAGSAAFVVAIKLFQAKYPLVKVYEISLITSPVSQSWSLSAIMEDTAGYSFGIAMWIAVLTMAWYANDYARQQKRAEEATQKQTQAELSMLRNQLNPHFLFNTLNNIYGLTLRKSDTAPNAVLQLSSIMRYVLYDADTALIHFDKEKEIMQAYVDMELLRLQGDVTCNVTIEADREYMVPPLLWMPVLENVFKHGTRMIADELQLEFSCTIVNGALQISSANQYKETKDQHGGLGLTNLRKRLEILYPGRHNIAARKEEGMYHITVKVQLD